MQTVHRIDALRRQLGVYRRERLRVALVPTMGALHEGHLRLVDEARTHADRVVVSIFVNPLQFGRGEDFETYPRDAAADARLLEERGVHLLFAPDVTEVYPAGAAAATRVEVPGLSDILCGAFRPGHFVGVATVVLKLFNMVQPDVALFGEKDYQQLTVIRRMVHDLDVPVKVIGVPTVREPDGLALSSRNRYLDAEQRAIAPELYRSLEGVAGQVAGGVDPRTAAGAAAARLEQAGFRPEYVEVLRAADLAPPGPDDRDLVVLAAAWLGRARLIDNLRFSRTD